MSRAKKTKENLRKTKENLRKLSFFLTTPVQKVLKMACLKGKYSALGALRGVPPMRGPPLRDLKGQFVECIVRPPLFSRLEDKNCRMYREPEFEPE